MAVESDATTALAALAFGLSVLVMAFLLPGHYVPWSSFEQQAMAAAGVMLVCAVVFAQGGSCRAALPPLAAVLVACAVVPPLQWATGLIRFASDAVLPAANLIACGLVVVAGATAAGDLRRRLIDGLGLAFIAAGIVSVGMATAQWLGQGAGIWVTDLPPGARPYANLGQPNHLATLLALATMGVLGCFEQRRLDGRVAALAVAWFGFGMVMTQSRTGWLFVALLVVWREAMHQRCGLRLGRAAVWSGALTFAVAALLWNPLNQLMLLAPGDFQRLKVGTRWTHWQTIADAIGRSPWTGYGWQQVGTAQQAAVLDHPATGEWLTNSHNLVLDLLVWNGVPLGLLLTALLVVWFVRQMRVCRSPDAWALLGAVGAVMLHALLEYPLDYTYFLLPTGLMMGLLDGMAGPGRLVVRLPRAVAAAALAALVGLLGWIGAEYLTVQETVRQLRFAMAGFVGAPTPPPPNVTLLDAPREFHRFWLTPAERGMPAKQLDWMREVTQRYAVPPALLRYALATGLNGRPQEAERALRLLCKLHPAPRCEEGRASWTELQGRYPELRAIPPPAAPS